VALKQNSLISKIYLKDKSSTLTQGMRIFLLKKWGVYKGEVYNEDGELVVCFKASSLNTLQSMLY